MKNKTYIVVLLVLVLFSLNFSVAHEMDNATIEDFDSSPIGNVLSIGDADSDVLKENSKLETQINIVSNTTFDVVEDYFKDKSQVQRFKQNLYSKH